MTHKVTMVFVGVDGELYKKINYIEEIIEFKYEYTEQKIIDEILAEQRELQTLEKILHDKSGVK